MQSCEEQEDIFNHKKIHPHQYEHLNHFVTFEKAIHHNFLIVIRVLAIRNCSKDP